MNKIFILIFLLIFCSHSYGEFPYENLDVSYTTRSNTLHEVPFMAPTKTQDGVGLCYGFSSTLLLENFRCRTLKLNCIESKNQISPLDVSSYLESNYRGLKEGGYSNQLLRNVSLSDRKLMKEECANFAVMATKFANDNEKNKDFEKNWEYLTLKWKQYKGVSKKPIKTDCISCLVDDIRSNLKTIQTPAEQLSMAFKTANNLEEFLYKAILPISCLSPENALEIPPFEVKTFPNENENSSRQALAQKIESILLNDIPIEISICVVPTRPGGCVEGQAHSLTLFAIKEVCSESQKQCRTMVRVKNSYGYKWQKDHNDGWVDLSTLIIASKGLAEKNNITWLSTKNSELKSLSLNRSGANSDFAKGDGNIPLIYKNFQGLWKCPGDHIQQKYESECVPFMEGH